MSSVTDMNANHVVRKLNKPSDKYTSEPKLAINVGQEAHIDNLSMHCVISQPVSEKLNP